MFATVSSNYHHQHWYSHIYLSLLLKINYKVYFFSLPFYFLENKKRHTKPFLFHSLGPEGQAAPIPTARALPWQLFQKRRRLDFTSSGKEGKHIHWLGGKPSRSGRLSLVKSMQTGCLSSVWLSGNTKQIISKG